MDPGLPSMIPGIYQVTRALKRESLSPYNCLCSILEDGAFVEEVHGLYPGVPLLANLRCGLWYTPRAHDTCYFKSTDGHQSNWNFSTVRLNLHVAELAAKHGAVMIVDATRNAHKGGVPDALGKTIPIWAAVLNRAVARLRATQQNGDGHQSAQKWDTDLHLPPWCSTNEQTQCDVQLNVWVDRLMEVLEEGGILSSLARDPNLKPFRPLWISQSSTLVAEEVAPPKDLPFTPLYLVSASQTNSSGSRKTIRGGQQAQGSYVYLPGAGDDEESWAGSLTPALLWAHSQELLDSGPNGVTACVHRIVAARSLIPSTMPPSHCGSTLNAKFTSNLRVATDMHHALPLGCAPLSGTSGTTDGGEGGQHISCEQLACGAYKIKSQCGLMPQLAVCSWNAIIPPPLLWKDVDVVCNLAPQQLNWQADLHSNSDHPSLWVPIHGVKPHRTALLGALQHAVPFCLTQGARGARILVLDSSPGFDHSVALALAVHLSMQVQQAEGRMQLTKDFVRRGLAHITTGLANIRPRPTRRSLKQVLSYLQLQDGN